jgi:hypothetical protein
LLHSYFLAVLVLDTLLPGDVRFGRTASHQHFLKVAHCERKSTCQLLSCIVRLAWKSSSEMGTNCMHRFVLFYCILFIIFPPTCFGELPSSGKIQHFHYIKHLKD